METVVPAQFLGQYPPALAEARSFRHPSLQKFKLSNGFKAVLSECHTVPLIHLHCLVPAGAQYDPIGLEGLASMTMRLLTAGTAKRNARQITEETEALGADILTRVDWHTGSLVIELLAEDMEYGVDLLADLLSSPVFPEQAVENARKRRMAILEQTRQASDLANERFARMIYGDGIYGRSLNGSKTGMCHIERENLIAFHSAHFGMNETIWIGVGSFSSAKLARNLESITSKIQPQRALNPPEIRPLALPRSRVCLVGYPNAALTEIRIGHAGIPQSHPDFVPFQLLTSILGRRLRLSLREQRGLTYSVRSRLITRRGPGAFVTAAAVGNDHVCEAVSEIVGEIKRLQEGPISEAEITIAQNHRRGIFQRSFQSGHEVAAQLKQVVANDLPDDYFERYLEQICSTDRERLIEAARGYIRPDQLAIVAVGPIAELRRHCKQFEEAFQVTLED